MLKCISPVRIELNVPKRGDKRLHDFGLRCRSFDLATMMAEARCAFQCKGDPVVSLCADNARRKEINQAVNQRLAPENSETLDTEEGPVLLYCGCPLIGTKNTMGVLNGVWYDVVGIEEETLHLKDEKSNVLAMSFQRAGHLLTLRHAMTVHKSQSRTISGHVRICPGRRPGDVSKYWSMNHLLVAASRATHINLLSIE